MRCLVNLSDRTVKLTPSAHVLLSSGQLVDHAVPTDTAVWLATKHSDAQLIPHDHRRSVQ
jgi:hypothetical protein